LTTPRSTATPAPAASGVEAALANLRAVITAARQQGTADQEAEDLLGQAGGPAQALRENPKDKDKSKDEGKGKGQQAAKKVAELQREVDELIGQGKIRPPAMTQINRPSPSWARQCSRQAKARMPARHLERPKPGASNGERGSGPAGSGRPSPQPSPDRISQLPRWRPLC
jgi:hypothetical protein